jgi:stress-induced morphogen
MATITRGSQDALVEKVKSVLDEYERQHSGAVATLYRQNSVSIRIRIVDESFTRLSKPERHDRAWKFISDRLDDEEIQDISVLLLLSPDEQRSSFMNFDFDDPIPSTL